MDEGAFDVIILGTGLTESITAAALSKAGFKVAHIDDKPYYGADEASLSLDEFIHWGDTLSSSPRFTSFTRSGDTLPQSRAYSISLSPSIIPSLGPLISSLVASGVSRYGGFRLIERVGVYDSSSGSVKSVPGSKEDIFKNKDISLLDKRRLMRFLMYAAGEVEGTKEIQGKEDLPLCDFLRTEFKLNEEMVAAIAYALAYCFSPSDPTLPALQRLQRYLRSAGRYGSSPFLVGHYGSSGEIAQGFCRTAAVCGAVYILGRAITSISHSIPPTTPPTTPPNTDATTTTDASSTPSPKPPVYTLYLSDFPDALTCDLLISSPSHVPRELLPDAKQVESPLHSDPSRNGHNGYTLARCVAIIDRPLAFGASAQQPGQPEPTSDDPSESPRSNDESNGGDPLEPESTSTTAPPPNDKMDTGILVFPPSSLEGGLETGAVTAFVVGEGTMSTPQGKWILYISAPLTPAAAAQSSPEDILTPYLNATLALTPPSFNPPSHNSLAANPPSADSTTPTTPTKPIKPLFTAFYFQHSSPPSSSSSHPSSTPVSLSSPVSVSSSANPTYPTPHPNPPPTLLIPPALPALPLPDAPDAAAVVAEAVFREAVAVLRAMTTRKLDSAVKDSETTDGAGDAGENEGGDADGAGDEDADADGDRDEPLSFWPPLDSVGGDEGDDL